MELEINTQNLHKLEYGSYTQAGTAERFIACFGEIVKWVEDTEKWKIYDAETGFWQDISSNAIYKMVKAISDKLEAEIVDIENPDTLKDLGKYIGSLRNLVHVKCALEFAKADVSCKQEDFDSNPRYLGMENGKVLDLVDCIVVDGCKEFMLTKKLNGSIHAPISDEFYHYINVLFKDEAIREYVQMYLGSALLGFRLRHTKDKRALFLDSADGDTGKTTLLTLLELTLGDYYKAVDSSILTAPIADANKPNPLLGELQGCRVVAISEIKKGSVFEDDNFKRFTGNDTLCCRFPYDRHLFRYKPDFRLLVVSNFLPKPQDVNDNGFRLRLRRYTFAQAIDKNEMEADIYYKFYQQEFIDDFLSWLLEGCKKYIAGGKMLDDYDGKNMAECNLPVACKAAMSKYFGENDSMGDFFGTFYKITGNDDDAVGLREMFGKWQEFTSDKKTGYYQWCDMARDSFIKKYKLKEAKRVLIIDGQGNVSKRAGIKGIASYTSDDVMEQRRTKKSSVFGDDGPKKSKGRFEIVS